MAGQVADVLHDQFVCAEQALASQLCWSTWDVLCTVQVCVIVSSSGGRVLRLCYGRANHGLIWAMLVYTKEAALIILICKVSDTQCM